MTIELSGQREQLILSLLRTGKFTSPNEVVDEGLRLVESMVRPIRPYRPGSSRRPRMV